MNTSSMLELCRTLRLSGVAHALEQQLSQPAFAGASFEQRMTMLLEAEASHRDTKRYARLLKKAKLKFQALPEDIDFSPGRGLDKSVVAQWLTCGWIIQRQNLIITGPTGTGKTWLACALAVEAARKGISVAYRRVSRILEEHAIGHEDGSMVQLRHQLSKVQLLILDDFGLTALSAQGRADLLELLDDRVGSHSTILLGQLPVKDWHDFIHDPALADAILDRLIHSSQKLVLKGVSMRRVKAIQPSS